MKYDPRNPSDRSELARALTAQLVAKKWKLASDNQTEDIYEWDMGARAPGCKIQVFTSLFRGEAREVGSDAIRVVGVYTTKGGRTRAVADETRVNRTGTIQDIVARTMDRVKCVFTALPGVERCRSCGAPKFKSRKGNKVCADLCFVSAPSKAPNPKAPYLRRDDSDGFGNDNGW